MITATVEELRSIALAAHDASGYFPAMYAQVTDRIRQAAEAGRFDDAERMERFATTFAGYFTRPRGGVGSVPRCWQAAFDVAGDGRLMIVQHLLLGINAHVNHDLPQVVVELAGDGELAPLKPDFDAVNQILAETLPLVLHSLGTVASWVNLVANRFGKRAFDFSLEVARDQAWRAATRLHGLPPDARPAAVHELDDLVSVLAHLTTNPGGPAAWAVRLGRAMERHDPVSATRSLLGPLA